MLVNTPLHPPIAVVEAKNDDQAAFTCACELQDGIVTSLPQFITTGAAGVIEKVAFTLSCEQLSAMLYVNETLPP